MFQNNDETTSTPRARTHEDLVTETYETPMKAARKAFTQHTERTMETRTAIRYTTIYAAKENATEHKMKPNTAVGEPTAIGEPSNSHAHEKVQPERHWRVRLRVQFPPELTFAPLVVQAADEDTPNDVKEIISAHIHIPAALLKLSGPPDAAKPKFNWPLEMSPWQDGSNIICTILEAPDAFDGVNECNGCGDLRHVFNGYARQDPLSDPVPVIELCADCSDRLQKPTKTIPQR